MRYEDVVKDAMDGRRVVVFCDSAGEVKLAKRGIVAAAERLGARRVLCPMRDAWVEVDGNTVRIFLGISLAYRGATADVVYLSDSARSQLSIANVPDTEIK